MVASKWRSIPFLVLLVIGFTSTNSSARQVDRDAIQASQQGPGFGGSWSWQWTWPLPWQSGGNQDWTGQRQGSMYCVPASMCGDYGQLCPGGTLMNFDGRQQPRFGSTGPSYNVGATVVSHENRAEKNAERSENQAEKNRDKSENRAEKNGEKSENWAEKNGVRSENRAEKNGERSENRAEKNDEKSENGRIVKNNHDGKMAPGNN